MDTKEIYDKLKRGQVSYDELLNWCNENKDKMNLNDSYESSLYNTLINYSMKNRIGKLNREEASIYLKFFAKKTAKDLRLDKKVVIEVLDAESYKKRDKDNSRGICIPNDDGTYNVVYNLDKLEGKLTSNNKYEFIFGLQTIFHEVRHVTQNVAISTDSDRLYNKSLYIMALETITRKICPEFYKGNYAKLLKENDADKNGLQLALQTIKERNPKLYELYSQEKMETLMKKYDKNFYEADFEIKGMKGSAIKSVDSWAELYIENHPEAISQYPVLKVAYDENGKKKDILKMLSEREEIIQKRPKDRIDELYKTVMNQKFFDREEGVTTEGELMALDKWIEKTGTEDEFIYDLVRFRLDRSELTDEEKDDFIKVQKAKASRVRKLRDDAQQEKQAEREKSIKDEVGDEFNGSDKENEQLWLDRMQLCYNKSTQIENYEGKQAEIIKAISEQLRKKDQKEIDEYLEK